MCEKLLQFTQVGESTASFFWPVFHKQRTFALSLSAGGIAGRNTLLSYEGMPGMHGWRAATMVEGISPFVAADLTGDAASS